MAPFDPTDRILFSLMFKMSPDSDGKDIVRGRFRLGIIPSVPSDDDVLDDVEDDGIQNAIFWAATNPIDFTSGRQHLGSNDWKSRIGFSLRVDFLRDANPNSEWILRLQLCPLKVRKI